MTRSAAIYTAKEAHRLFMTRAIVPAGVTRFALTFGDHAVTHHFYDVPGWRIELRSNGALVMALRA